MAVFAYLFLPFDEIGHVVRRANYLYVGPALLAYFAGLYFRGLRWRYLLRPLVGNTRRALFPVVVVGYMANNILPVRLGEIVRSYYLGLREDISSATAFGTIAVERVFDVFTLLLFIALVWLLPGADMLGSVAEGLPGGTPLLIAFSVLPFIGITVIIGVIVAVPANTVLLLAERLMFFVPAVLKVRLLTLAARLITGLTVVRSPGRLASVLLMSLPIWIMEGTMLWIIAQGFDIGPSLGSQVQVVAAVMLFLAVANLSLVVPSAAGGVGPFNFFGAATLVALGVADAEAGAYVLTSHIALLLPVTVLGFILLFSDHMSLRALLYRAQSAPEEPEAVDADAPDGEETSAEPASSVTEPSR